MAALTGRRRGGCWRSWRGRSGRGETPGKNSASDDRAEFVTRFCARLFHSLDGLFQQWNTAGVQVEVVVTAEFVAWWDGLSVPEQASVAAVVDLLELFGPGLGFPHSSAIAGSKKLRELRIQHRGKPYRVLYAFDPARNAILLIGGNKAGRKRWYEQNVPRAEELFARYLRESSQKQEVKNGK